MLIKNQLSPAWTTDWMKRRRPPEARRIRYRAARGWHGYRPRA
ncbi:MAG: hypothetical protein WKG07_04380 [Hymenobacter sp.]